MTSSTVDVQQAVAVKVSVKSSLLKVELADGRIISVPLDWFPRLQAGTPKERSQWTLIAKGNGIHWPDLDEDISVTNLLLGQRSAESKKSLEKWRLGKKKKG